MKILLDMNLSPLWTGELARAGFEAIHWSAVGAAPAEDSEIMEYAARHGMVVLTHDLDFSAILAATQGTRPSVVQIPASDPSFELVGETVVRALRQMRGELATGALLTVDTKRVRVRVLPFPKKTQ
ncbi:MAG: DUF5615 family PIN-like protein [Terracidiphilus sp.]